MADDDLLKVADGGIAALTRGDAHAARTAFETVVASGKAAPQAWLEVGWEGFPGRQRSAGRPRRSH